MDQLSIHTKNLIQQLQKDIESSSTIYILSSFIMHSGVELIYDYLEQALVKGSDIKILTGDYLYVTQPKALEKLLELKGDTIEIRLWKSRGISFHPKTFIFKHETEGAIIVGSSNLSRSALTTGVEWNLRFQRAASPNVYAKAIHSFITLFYDEQTVEINDETIQEYKRHYKDFHVKNTNFQSVWTKREEIELSLPVDTEETVAGKIEESTNYDLAIKPRPAQEEALAALEETVLEEYHKAMVVMATGLGKTYLAAFFAKNYHRVLFIAHREEILKQARDSFTKVLNISGGLYYGNEKDISQPLIFASIYTLSIQDHLKKFKPDDFDLIIVDEFHHAAAKSYLRVIEYFKPKFLLGLTATPERTDGKDVFALCDGNVAYEISFIEAIRRGWLSPFTYYGIKDDIDYSKIKWLGSRYDRDELLVEQINEERANFIYDNWKKLRQTRSLGFCSSIEQANYLAEFFTEKGVQAISLTSETKGITRAEAIKKLDRQDIDIIFTVDLFNEGVDIPSVDTLLFVRPTESLVVFTQQIGRGLRKFVGKESCVIIDLIGNYRHADTKLQVFGEYMQQGDSTISIPSIPSSCKLEFSPEVIDLLKELRKKRSPRRERLYEDYKEVKSFLGKRPTYRQVHLFGHENSREYRQIYGGYFSFLYDRQELNDEERLVYERHHNWLKKLEKESMTKSYKMVVLKYMLSRGPLKWHEPVTPLEVAPFFHRYYMEKEYRRKIDFSNRNTKALWEYNEEKVAQLIRKMPMDKWQDKNSNLVLFESDELILNFSINSNEREILYDMTKQICEYRLAYYFERKGYKST